VAGLAAGSGQTSFPARRLARTAGSGGQEPARITEFHQGKGW
jgi:hypothetical protein